ncbi:MAG: hypothetical protein HY911_00125 [Desulfobacterales bacterium]|nr:hypothetical protein [Desulfobacterales bacterium]
MSYREEQRRRKEKRSHDAWQKILKTPEKYIACDPNEMLKAARDLPDTKAWLAYLKARYW